MQNILTNQNCDHIQKGKVQQLFTICWKRSVFNLICDIEGYIEWIYCDIENNRVLGMCNHPRTKARGRLHLCKTFTDLKFTNCFIYHCFNFEKRRIFIFPRELNKFKKILQWFHIKIYFRKPPKCNQPIDIKNNWLADYSLICRLQWL